MEGKMKVCVLTGKQKLEWVERDIPQPAAGELQIKLEYVGICGSDLHFYQEGQLANWTLDGPLALGHEPGGVVTAIGEGVTGFEIGDKVSIEPAVPCGECEECRKGLYNLCTNIKMLAIPHERDGVNAEYCVHDASMCYKLPENVSTLEGAMIEPLQGLARRLSYWEADVSDSALLSLLKRAASARSMLPMLWTNVWKKRWSLARREYSTVRERALKSLRRHCRAAALIRYTNVQETVLRHCRLAV